MSKPRKLGGKVKAARVLTMLVIPGVVFVGLALLGAIGNARTEMPPTANVAKPAARVALTPEEREYLARLGPITVCPDPDWVPFEHVDEHGRFTGIAADLLDLVAQRLGIEFTYVFPKDWDEALALSKAGEVLILPFLNQTPAREEWLIFTEPLFVEPNVFITREEHPFIFDATQLTDETIVLPSGTSMEERVRRDFPNLRVINAPTEREVFKAILDREADMTLRSLHVAAYTIRKEGLFNLKIAGQAPDAYVNRLRMGVLRSEPLLRDILNKGIAAITPREREEIVNRHVNITIVTPMDYALILRVAGLLAALIAVSLYWNYRLKKINAALQESERGKSVLLSNLPGIAYRCRYDRQWTMEFISEGCLELTGYKSADLLGNRTISYNDLIHPEDRESVRRVWERAKLLGQPGQLEYRIVTADQQEKWVFEQGIFIDGGKDDASILEGLIIDITARKNAEQELYRVSIHDELTGLYNRRYMFERLNALIKEHQRENRSFSVAIIDLDFFKKINDNYGHPAGDFILKEFSSILTANSRAYDLMGRYGGEEFIAIVMNSDTREIRKILIRLREIIKDQVFDIKGNSLKITFSAGVANTCEFGLEATVERLIGKADERLYLAKEQGRDRIVCA